MIRRTPPTTRWHVKIYTTNLVLLNFLIYAETGTEAMEEAEEVKHLW